MKVTLLMATTINGYIAGTDDDTNWIKDEESFYEMVENFGIVVLGKKTYEELMKSEAFPHLGAINIVMTNDQKLLKKSEEKVIFTDKSPQKVIELATEKGFDTLLLTGGGHLNGSFMKDGLIDEIILDIHPYLKADGIRLFEGKFNDQHLEFVSSKELNDQILRVEYHVRK